MKKIMVLKLQSLYKRYIEIQVLLTKKDVIINNKKFSALSREFLKLSRICKYFINWKLIKKDIISLKELLHDSEMYELAYNDLKNSYIKKKKIEKKIKFLLIPIDPNDKNGCIIEIHAATGGDEASIFAGDLFRMYSRYAELNSWNINIMHVQHSVKGGFKEIIFKIIGYGACGKLKFESGGHRVQRIPKTESQGRLHTSTCTVAVMPIVKQSKLLNILPNDLKIDTFRASGAGGQHVNTTDSAIRITHIPTGIVAECQDERSQHKNKAKALSILSARVYNAKILKKNKKKAFLRKNLLGTGERSDRNRTYNFPQNRVTDHRINLNLYCLNDILAGNMDLLIQPIIQEYHADILLNISK
ncbi:peptide chain release factor 1 [Buchnera aphidicola (Mollitrichosiphum nigrofasciatum)]|uniref:peptide chain release factor 1 n=1 Tax=Buchnera aphidicola TaxID=9 RepID=UPI0031B81C4F